MSSRPTRPERLRPGDVVRIIAPSGPVRKEAFEAGVALLSARYDVRFDPAVVFAEQGFLAGPDEVRLDDLRAALSNHEARALFMGRGGYGLLRIASDLDPDLFRRSPKIIVGFSDGTVLLARAAQAGVSALHGPVVTQLSRLPEGDRAALFALLESDAPRTLLDGLRPLVSGVATGPLIGGNLEVFSRLLGTKLLPDLDGAILFFEDVGERPYRIDRLLTHLALAGVFDRVAAVVVGDLIDCEEPANSPLKSPSALDVVTERLSRLRIPVALGGRFGHGDRNLALPYNVPARLDTQTGTLAALESAVT